MTGKAVNDLLAPGIFGLGKPPLDPVARELHALVSAAGRMGNAQERIAASLEAIARDVAAMRTLAEHSNHR